jgi:hypothetical protein
MRRSFAVLVQPCSSTTLQWKHDSHGTEVISLWAAVNKSLVQRVVLGAIDGLRIALLSAHQARMPSATSTLGKPQGVLHGAQGAVRGDVYIATPTSHALNRLFQYLG